jgi:hypothetical protein
VQLPLSALAALLGDDSSIALCEGPGEPDAAAHRALKERLSDISALQDSSAPLASKIARILAPASADPMRSLLCDKSVLRRVIEAVDEWDAFSKSSTSNWFSGLFTSTNPYIADILQSLELLLLAAQNFGISKSRTPDALVFLALLVRFSACVLNSPFSSLLIRSFLNLHHVCYIAATGPGLLTKKSAKHLTPCAPWTLCSH